MCCILSFINAIITIYLNNGIPDLWKLYDTLISDIGIPLYNEFERNQFPQDFLYSLERNTYLPDDLKDFYNYTHMIGHTLVTLQFGIFAANTDLTFSDALLEVIKAGGDTDTNGAVAGAILGARYGYGFIPVEWENCISSYDRITNLAERLVLND